MSDRPLWTSEEAAHATKGECVGRWTASGVSINSRTVSPGDLFVALRGPDHDGHDYVGQALDGGAAAAVVSRSPVGSEGRKDLLIVGDTKVALEALGAHARNRSSAKVVAVTGSVGKTGTKDALKSALAATAPCHASASSLNNHWGVPLSLSRLPKEAGFGVFEIGMNHAGEIRPLTKSVRPHVAIITTVEATHLEYLGTVEAVADAKAEVALLAAKLDQLQARLEEVGRALATAESDKALQQEKIEDLGLETTAPKFVEGREFSFWERAFVDFDGHLIVLYQILEPERTGADIVAGAIKAARAGRLASDETVVCLVTGSGAKWPEVMAELADRDAPVEPAWEEIVARAGLAGDAS